MAASAGVSARGQRGICFSPLHLGQTLGQTLHPAQYEYIKAYGADSWRETIRTSHEQSANHMSPDPPSPLQRLLPRRHRTHLLPPNRTEFIPRYVLDAK